MSNFNVTTTFLSNEIAHIKNGMLTTILLHDRYGEYRVNLVNTGLHPSCNDKVVVMPDPYAFFGGSRFCSHLDQLKNLISDVQKSGNKNIVLCFGLTLEMPDEGRAVQMALRDLRHFALNQKAGVSVVVMITSFTTAQTQMFRHMFTLESDRFITNKPEAIDLEKHTVMVVKDRSDLKEWNKVIELIQPNSIEQNNALSDESF